MSKRDEQGQRRGRRMGPEVSSGPERGWRMGPEYVSGPEVEAHGIASEEPVSLEPAEAGRRAGPEVAQGAEYATGPEVQAHAEDTDSGDEPEVEAHRIT